MTPHPRSTGAHPVTMPASMASAHVEWVQQAPASPHTWLAPQPGPQVTEVPHAFFTWPQVAAPQTGAGQVTHIPPEHWVPVGQVAQATFPLPQAFATLPQRRTPESASVHSGGGGAQTPAVHC